MKRVLLAVAVAMTVFAAVTSARISAGRGKKKVVGLTSEQVRWFTPPYYKDGRQRRRYTATQVRKGRGWIGLRYPPAGASSGTRTRMTNW